MKYSNLILVSFLMLIIIFLPVNEKEEKKYKTNNLTEIRNLSFTRVDIGDKMKLINKLKTEQKEVEVVSTVKSEWKTYEATAYTAFCSTGCIGITRTGYDVSETIYYKDMEIIAVDPNVIPLHSIVEVDTGSRVFTAIALDTGGAIKNFRVDLLKETKSAARKFGRRDVKIRVLEWGE